MDGAPERLLIVEELQLLRRISGVAGSRVSAVRIALWAAMGSH
jgi:hypothetical protein